MSIKGKIKFYSYARVSTDESSNVTFNPEGTSTTEDLRLKRKKVNAHNSVVREKEEDFQHKLWELFKSPKTRKSAEPIVKSLLEKDITNLIEFDPEFEGEDKSKRLVNLKKLQGKSAYQKLSDEGQKQFLALLKERSSGEYQECDFAVSYVGANACVFTTRGGSNVQTKKHRNEDSFSIGIVENVDGLTDTDFEKFPAEVASRLQKATEEKEGNNPKYVGGAANAFAVVQGNKVHVANQGDCRFIKVILTAKGKVKEVKFLNSIHHGSKDRKDPWKVESKEESARLQKLFVEADQSKWTKDDVGNLVSHPDLEWKWDKNGWRYGGLNLTRGLGDNHNKTVSHDPENSTHTFEVENGEIALLLGATDGFELTEQETTKALSDFPALQFSINNGNPEQSLRKLAKELTEVATEKSGDNVTVGVMLVEPKKPHVKRYIRITDAHQADDVAVMADERTEAIIDSIARERSVEWFYDAYPVGDIKTQVNPTLFADAMLDSDSLEQEFFYRIEKIAKAKGLELNGVNIAYNFVWIDPLTGKRRDLTGKYGVDKSEDRVQKQENFENGSDPGKIQATMTVDGHKCESGAKAIDFICTQAPQIFAQIMKERMDDYQQEQEQELAAKNTRKEASHPTRVTGSTSFKDGTITGGALLESNDWDGENGILNEVFNNLQLKSEGMKLGLAVIQGNQIHVRSEHGGQFYAVVVKQDRSVTCNPVEATMRLDLESTDKVFLIGTNKDVRFTDTDEEHPEEKIVFAEAQAIKQKITDYFKKTNSDADPAEVNKKLVSFLKDKTIKKQGDKKDNIKLTVMPINHADNLNVRYLMAAKGAHNDKCYQNIDRAFEHAVYPRASKACEAEITRLENATFDAAKKQGQVLRDLWNRTKEFIHENPALVPTTKKVVMQLAEKTKVYLLDPNQKGNLSTTQANILANRNKNVKRYTNDHLANRRNAVKYLAAFLDLVWFCTGIGTIHQIAYRMSTGNWGKFYHSTERRKLVRQAKVADAKLFNVDGVSQPTPTDSPRSTSRDSDPEVAQDNSQNSPRTSEHGSDLSINTQDNDPQNDDLDSPPASPLSSKCRPVQPILDDEVESEDESEDNRYSPANLP